MQPSGARPLELLASCLMRLRTVYTVSFGHGADKLALPLHLTLRNGDFELAKDNRGGVLTCLLPVETEGLSVDQGEAFPDGHKNPPTIIVPRDAVDERAVHDVIAALNFLSDVRMSIAARGEKKLVAENDLDRELLGKLGTDWVHFTLHGQLSMRTFSIPNIDSDAFEKLLERRAGLHLYEEAMHLDRPVAKFRELWRVLESAFDRQDAALVDLLAQYQPALDLKFTLDELKGLLVLRGRASHAATRAGVVELRRVNHEVQQCIGRLTSLVEQVIVTKKSWGYPTRDVDRFAAMTSFVGPNNALTLFRPPF